MPREIFGLDTLDMGHVDEAMAGFERMTRAVAEGRAEPQPLAQATMAALAEAETFAHQLADDTFTGDEASKGWRDGAAEAVGALCGALYGMLHALQAEPVDREALVAQLESTLAAERRVRDIYRYADAYRTALRTSLEKASRVPCMKCGHLNMPGRSTCEQCRFQLPQLGVERVEADIVGGESSMRESVFLERLDLLMDHLETEDGPARLVEFLQNLERLYIMGGRQVDTMLAHAPRDHEATRWTVELRGRMEQVRQMTEAVRLSAAAGDLSSLHDFRHWLADQFNILVDLKERVAAACG